MKKPVRPAILNAGRPSPNSFSAQSVGICVTPFPLRDVEEPLLERGLEADHTTVWRWIQRYGPELERRLRHCLKPTNKSWRVDETYVSG